MRQIEMATAMYVSDADGTYPQTKDSSGNPAVDDAGGSMDEPDYGSVFELLLPYSSGRGAISNAKIFACPSDMDPFGVSCFQLNPDTPAVTSDVINAYLIFGTTESAIPAPASLISFSERRSQPTTDGSPFCDYLYHPWFNATNPLAPEDQMDATTGAIATTRHNGLANYAFADGHAKTLHWTQTFSLPATNLHQP
jgi:prepilin-type processing-associated H-X9-DG protein